MRSPESLGRGKLTSPLSVSLGNTGSAPPMVQPPSRGTAGAAAGHSFSRTHGLRCTSDPCVISRFSREASQYMLFTFISVIVSCKFFVVESGSPLLQFLIAWVLPIRSPSRFIKTLVDSCVYYNLILWSRTLLAKMLDGNRMWPFKSKFRLFDIQYNDNSSFSINARYVQELRSLKGLTASIVDSVDAVCPFCGKLHWTSVCRTCSASGWFPLFNQVTY